MPNRRQAPERRELPDLVAAVVPCAFLNIDITDQASVFAELDLIDDESGLLEIAGVQDVTPSEAPYDPFTAWVAFACLGGIEQGGPIFKSELTREQRLEIARAYLTEAQFLAVESIAVPRHYRKLPARELESMVRTADDYIDRMWAGLWLTLVGWTRSPECSLRSTYEMPRDSMSEMEEAIVEAYARTIGVGSPDNQLGWRRIDTGYEANLIHRRIEICNLHYNINGPPLYEHMKDTIPVGPGWKQIVRIVPMKDPPPNAS